MRASAGSSTRRATSLAVLSTLLVVLPLVAIFVYLIFKGAHSLNLAFFTEIPKPVGEEGGGMANAIVGSVTLLAIASLLEFPSASAAASTLPSLAAAPSLPTACASPLTFSTAFPPS